MVDTWQPDIETNSITNTELADLVTTQDVENNLKAITAEQKQIVAGWLKLPESQWLSALEGLNQDQLRALCEFFTLGEMQIADWACGSNNPTIFILRRMKALEIYPEKDFIRSLKKRTDNRYIPYGNALG